MPYRKCPFSLPTPSLPVKAGSVSSRLIMRYTSRAVYLQGCEVPPCINRALIHNIRGDVFTYLSRGKECGICGKLWLNLLGLPKFSQFISLCIFRPYSARKAIVPSQVVCEAIILRLLDHHFFGEKRKG